MDQGQLDFAGAAASRADRRNQLLLAVDRVDGGSDLHLMIFCERVWECWERGEPLVASYPQLAGPRMLRCSPSKARKVVATARDAGLVSIDVRYDGAQQSNAYSLRWSRDPAVSTEQAPVSTEQAPVSTEQAPVSTEQALSPQSRRLSPQSRRLSPQSRGGAASSIPAGKPHAHGRVRSESETEIRRRRRRRKAAPGRKRFGL